MCKNIRAMVGSALEPGHSVKIFLEWNYIISTTEATYLGIF